MENLLYAAQFVIVVAIILIYLNFLMEGGDND